MVAPGNPVSGVDLGIPGLGPGTLVGRGGFAVVYRAVQLSSGGPVAVKVLSGYLDDLSRSRFERETAALGLLREHPNICTVFDAGVDAAGRPYLLMEFASRGSLATRLASEGPLPWVDVLGVGVKLAGALETAHRAGLLHRDVKPENVLVTAYGEPRLADFGLARFTDDSVSRGGGLTTTVAHAAPELLRAKAPSVGSDIYALGSTLFALLSGRAAFAANEDEHLGSVFRRIEEDPLPAVAGVPHEVIAAMARAMAKEPADRYESAAALGAALQDVQRARNHAVTALPLPLDDAIAEAREVVEQPTPRPKPGDSPTPRLPAAEQPTPRLSRSDQGPDAGDVTRTVERSDRMRPEPKPQPAPSGPEHAGGDTEAATKPGNRRRALIGAGAGVVFLLTIATTIALAAGGGNDPSGSTGSTTSATPTPTPTDLSSADQFAVDLPLIKAYWDSYNNAWLSSAEQGYAFQEARNHPEADDLSQCPPNEEDLKAPPLTVTVDEATVKREDDWIMPSGQKQGRVPSGRIYVMKVQFLDATTDPPAPAGDANVHVAIFGDAAYGFFACE